jgi:hypothetical protein
MDVPHGSLHRKQQGWVQPGLPDVASNKKSYATHGLTTGKGFDSIQGNPDGIRAQLKKWEEQYGADDPMADFRVGADPDDESTAENFTHLPDLKHSSLLTATSKEEVDNEYTAPSSKESDFSSAMDEVRMLGIGDLVELPTSTAGKTILAVHIRPVGEWGMTGQFINIFGRTCHSPYAQIPWIAKNWMDPSLIKPILPYMPIIKTEAQITELADIAIFEDISAPRSISAPLIEQITNLSQEADEIYRHHSDSLDRAHEILAHESDLRYGSLESIAQALLNIQNAKVSTAALCAVRRALRNGGVAFNVDFFQHRATGYVQIPSRQDIKGIQDVQKWIRSWQENVVNRETHDGDSKSEGFRIIDSFIKKAKGIVLKSRALRLPAKESYVGPCRVQRAITESKGCVEETCHSDFTNEEQAIVRFLYAWAAARRFDIEPTLMGLPPLLMHATGLYIREGATEAQGYLFLQELGVVLPYGGKYSFNSHLLLPTSGQSRPLLQLMNKLEDMGTKDVTLTDTMQDLRHDWGNLTVYCVDDAGAKEIDDGISVEKAGVGADGKQEYWMHLHIANPTAFFDRKHSLAKMARHMGETIYTPEYTHSMLPTWLTHGYLDVGRNRPVMTFSARLDEAGNILEHRIRNGIVRNVLSLTYDDLNKLIGTDGESGLPSVILSTGDVLSGSSMANDANNISSDQLDEMRTLDRLTRARMSVRAKRGGLFYDLAQADASVMSRSARSGLGPPVPYFAGRREVTGDPVVQVRTYGLKNQFASNTRPSDVFVREAMLLACEIAGTWCKERAIPTIFRGTVSHPLFPNPEKYLQEHVLPNVDENGAFPRDQGRRYVQMLGYGVIRTHAVQHSFLGMSAYTKATSPLRRYGDLVLHWQIEAALRHEAETGVSLVVENPEGTTKKTAVNPAPDRSFLPFSAANLETMIPGLRARELTIIQTKRRSNEHWIRTLLWRKHYYPEQSGGPISDTFPKLHIVIESSVDEIFATDHRGIILEFGIKTRVATDDTQPGQVLKPGQIWECELYSIEMYKGTTVVVPKKLVVEDGAEDYTSWRTSALLGEEGVERAKL